MSRTSAAAGQRTGVRILDGALVLFNRDGTAQVTTNDIAAHIGISPGNLYYWYSDKQEIIRALWERFAAQRSVLWEFGDTLPDPDETIERVGAAVELSRRYWFLTRELHGLVHADAELRAPYTADRDRRLGMLSTLARSWRADGLLRPVDDTRLADLVQTLWVLTESWFAHAPLAEAATPANAERLLLVVLDPYLSPRP